MGINRPRLHLSSFYTYCRESVTNAFREAGVPDTQLQDLTQEFFLSVLEWAHRNERSSFSCLEFVHRIQLFLRIHRRRPEQPLQSSWEPAEDWIDRLSHRYPTLDTNFESVIITRQLLQTYLHHMTEKSQLAVILYYLVGMTREETGELLSVSSGTVATQAFRGIRQARSYWSGAECEEPRNRPKTWVRLAMEWGFLPLSLTRNSAQFVLTWKKPPKEPASVPLPGFEPNARPVPLWPRGRLRSLPPFGLAPVKTFHASHHVED